MAIFLSVYTMYFKGCIIMLKEREIKTYKLHTTLHMENTQCIYLSELHWIVQREFVHTKDFFYTNMLESENILHGGQYFYILNIAKRWIVYSKSLASDSWSMCFSI